MRLAAVLLAAGGSTRMGEPKQLLLSHNGESFVRSSARLAIEAGFDPVIVVLGCRAELIQPELAGLPVIVEQNVAWERGMGSSLRAGVRAALRKVAGADATPAQSIDANLDGVAILLVDQAAVGRQALEELRRRFERSDRPVCVSEYAGTIGPPVIVASTLVPRLLALPDHAGAKAVWVDHPEWLERCPMEAAADDIDTPADFDRFKSRTGEGS